MRMILPVAIMFCLFSCGPSYVNSGLTDVERDIDHRGCREAAKRELLKKSDNSYYFDCREKAISMSSEFGVDESMPRGIRKEQKTYLIRRIESIEKECADAFDKSVRKCMMDKGYDVK